MAATMKARKTLLLLLLLPLLAEGLPAAAASAGRSRGREARQQQPRQGQRRRPRGQSRVCDRALQRRYCDAPYGGDLHTACRYCGVGLSCPAGRPADRGLDRRPDAMREILRRHNTYRDGEQRAFRIADVAFEPQHLHKELFADSINQVAPKGEQ